MPARDCSEIQLWRVISGRPKASRNREAGETLMDIARSYGVSHLTIMRLAASSPFEHGAVVAQ